MEDALLKARVTEVHPGNRLRQWRQDRGWTMDDVQARSGVDKSTLSRIEALSSVGRIETLIQLADAFDKDLSELYATQPTATVPEVVCNSIWDGDVRTPDHVPPGLSRKGEEPRWPRLPCAGAGERWRGLIVDLEQPTRVDLGEVHVDLRPGDLLIMAPPDEVPPRSGAYVHAIADRGIDGVQSELRVYRVVNGVEFLWQPFEGEQPDFYKAPWEIVAVAVELRRRV